MLAHVCGVVCHCVLAVQWPELWQWGCTVEEEEDSRVEVVLVQGRCADRGMQGPGGSCSPHAIC